MPLLDSVFGFPRARVQRAYNWDCIMPDIWGAGILGVVISKFCQSVTIGEYNIDDIRELRHGAFKKFFPGALNITNPSVTFVAPVPDVVSFYFHSWRRLIVDERGFYQVEKNYKKNIYIVFYDTTGVPVNMITLKNAFPKSFPAYNLSYAADDVVKYTIEFKVDDIITGLRGFSSFANDAISAIRGVASGGAISAVGNVLGNIF